MSDNPKTKAHVLRSFKDEGTGESFKAGAKPLLDAGTFANYKAADLVEAAPVDTAKPKTAQ